MKELTKKQIEAIEIEMNCHDVEVEDGYITGIKNNPSNPEEAGVRLNLIEIDDQEFEERFPAGEEKAEEPEAKDLFNQFYSDYIDIEGSSLAVEGIIKYISATPDKQGDFLKWLDGRNTTDIEDLLFDDFPEEFKFEWYNCKSPAAINSDHEEPEAWEPGTEEHHEQYAEGCFEEEVR